MLRPVLMLRMNQGHPTLDMVMLAIDQRNVEELMRGRPLLVKANSMGLPCDVCVTYGHTLIDVVDQLAATDKFDEDQIVEMRRAAERTIE